METAVPNHFFQLVFFVKIKIVWESWCFFSASHLFLQDVWSLELTSPPRTKVWKSCWTPRIRCVDIQFTLLLSLWYFFFYYIFFSELSQVFNEIRNEHFSNVFGFLSQKARNLQTAYDVGFNLLHRWVSEANVADDTNPSFFISRWCRSVGGWT